MSREMHRVGCELWDGATTLNVNPLAEHERDNYWDPWWERYKGHTPTSGYFDPGDV
jgi:hypothetical protein